MAAEPPQAQDKPIMTLVDQGRDALARHAWDEALDRLTEADRRGELHGMDLLLLADAAWWNGRLPLAIETRERAYAAAIKAHEPEAAVMAAIALGRDNIYRFADAEAAGWLARAAKLLDGVPENRGHGWLAATRAFRAALTGDIETAAAEAARAEDIGRRFRGRRRAWAGRRGSRLLHHHRHVHGARGARAGGGMDRGAGPMVQARGDQWISRHVPALPFGDQAHQEPVARGRSGGGPGRDRKLPRRPAGDLGGVQHPADRSGHFEQAHG